jgi:hypothetical protein
VSPPLLHDDVDTDANVHASQSASQSTNQSEKVKVGTEGQGGGGYRKECEGERGDNVRVRHDIKDQNPTMTIEAVSGKQAQAQVEAHKPSNQTNAALPTQQIKKVTSTRVPLSKTDAIALLKRVRLGGLTTYKHSIPLGMSEIRALVIYAGVKMTSVHNTKAVAKQLLSGLILKGAFDAEIKTFNARYKSRAVPVTINTNAPITGTIGASAISATTAISGPANTSTSSSNIIDIAATSSAVIGGTDSVPAISRPSETPAHRGKDTMNHKASKFLTNNTASKGEAHNAVHASNKNSSKSSFPVRPTSKTSSGGNASLMRNRPPAHVKAGKLYLSFIRAGTLQRGDQWIPIPGNLAETLNRSTTNITNEGRRGIYKQKYLESQIGTNIRTSSVGRDLILNYSSVDWETCAQVTIDKLEIGNPDYLLHKLVSAGAGAFSGVPLARPGARASAVWESASGVSEGGDEIRNENEIENRNGVGTVRLRDKDVPQWLVTCASKDSLLTPNEPNASVLTLTERATPSSMICNMNPRLTTGIHRKNVASCLQIYPAIKFVTFTNDKLGLRFTKQNKAEVLMYVSLDKNAPTESANAVKDFLRAGDALVYISGVCPLSHLSAKMQARLLQITPRPIVLGFISDNKLPSSL